MRKPVEEDKNYEQLRIVEEKDEYYRAAMEKFNGYCVACYPHSTIFGVTVHEVIPKSKRPKDWWLIPDNGCPLCVIHHDYVHTLPSQEGEEFCRSNMERALQGLGKL